MKVYLCGPMTGYDEYNFPAFRAAAADLREANPIAYEVISPVELDEQEGFDASGQHDEQLSTDQYAAMLARDIKVIAHEGVEAIVVLPGWEKSGGARTEVAFGQALKLPILQYPGMVEVGTIAAAESGEVRIVNPDTGGEKGRKPARMGLLPWAQLQEVAALYAAGAEKYEDHNWRRGFVWSLSFDAMMRHAGQFWEGEDYDEETGAHHLTSVVFHALALLYFKDHYPELDDRPNTLDLTSGS